MDPAPNTISAFLTTLTEPRLNAGLLVAMLVLLAFSFLFSSIETAFSTFNRIRMKSLSQGGDKRAELVLKLDNKYDKLLTSVLIGNNIVNIALSTIATIFFMDVIVNNESVAATVSTVVITIVVLIFGEISPKVIAKENADKYAIALAPVVNFIMIVLTPLSIIFGGWSKLMHKLFHSEDQSTLTEDELITIVDEAEEGGVLETEESNLIKSAIEFNDVCAGDILTPRVEICAISKDDSVQDIAKTFIESAYSRLPVYGEDLDDIIGILHEQDFFIAYHNNNKTITKHLQKPVHVSEHIKMADLLQVLKSKKCHMAIVVDEYGGTMGIVTMEDIIEELIGDVWDEHDEVVNDYKELPDGSYIVKCSTDLDDFFDKFDIIVPPEEEDLPQTVNGFIMKELESFPQVGDSFEYRGISLEIKKIGPKRIEEVKVTKINNDEDDEKAAE